MANCIDIKFEERGRSSLTILSRSIFIFYVVSGEVGSSNVLIVNFIRIVAYFILIVACFCCLVRNQDIRAFLFSLETLILLLTVKGTSFGGKNISCVLQC